MTGISTNEGVAMFSKCRICGHHQNIDDEPSEVDQATLCSSCGEIISINRVSQVQHVIGGGPALKANLGSRIKSKVKKGHHTKRR